jgi:putative Ca2+/H+ antiporter (TMEM165/GDT1 family)
LGGESFFVTALLTTMATVFITELSDKDALFLLALATKTKASVVFVAGSVAFTITTTIIVLFGTLLIRFVPIIAIKLVGGSIMLAYAIWGYYGLSREQHEIDEREERLLGRSASRGTWSIFLPAVLTLIALDIAGDATELVTIIMVARFNDALVVFLGAVVGLIAAVAVETALGNRLGKVLSPERIKYLSILIFIAIGTIVIVTTLFGA